MGTCGPPITGTSAASIDQLGNGVEPPLPTLKAPWQRLLAVPGDVGVEAYLGPAPDVNNNHLYTFTRQYVVSPQGSSEAVLTSHQSVEIGAAIGEGAAMTRYPAWMVITVQAPR